MKVMVYDVGGTETKYSVMDEERKVYARGVIPTPQDSLTDFLDAVEGIYRENGEGTAGIAMSLPGIIDTEEGVARTGGWLKYNWGQPLAELICDRCGCPVHLDNDGKCAATAEYYYGSLQGCRNGAVFIIGTGVAGGLIINGSLLRGSGFSAGEFSYLCTNRNAWGTNEDLAGFCCSTNGFLSSMRKAKAIPDSVPFNGRDAFRYINEGDEEALAVLRAFARNVAIQLYNLDVLLNLDKVAIGGGISRQPLLLSAIREARAVLMEQATEMTRNSGFALAEIVPCAFGNEAGQLGALQGFLQRFAPARQPQAAPAL